MKVVKNPVDHRPFLVNIILSAFPFPTDHIALATISMGSTGPRILGGWHSLVYKSLQQDLEVGP